MDFQTVDRTYAAAAAGFRLRIPEHFNFAFDVIDDWGARDDHTAVIAVSRDGETVRNIPYSALSTDSNRFANALAGLGVGAGSFACVVMGRVPAWYTVLFGCMKTGVISMPGTNLLTAHDIEYRVNHSGASVIVVGSEHCEKVERIRDRCPTLATFIVADGGRDGWLSLDRLLDEASPDLDRAAFPNTRATDMMMAYFTSGTTSMPKMVPRDHGYALAHAATGLFWMDLRRGDVHWSLTDTGWAKAAWGMLFPQMLIGTPTVLYDGATAFEPDLHLRLIGRLGVTTFCAPPTVYRLFAQQDLARYDLRSIRRSLSAGEPLNPEVMRIWKEATGTVIADGYGQTETVNIVANFPGEEVRYGSMGRPVPGFDVDVVDEEGRRLAAGEVGHIAVKVTDPWPNGLFAGYHTGAEPDTKSFRHGWYYTGDTARRDEDGYLWFVGRSDDLISSAGYRISPFEVESALIEHPAVAESAVIGKPDPVRGQIVKAYVILARGYAASEELAHEIQAFCRDLTAPYKYPREIEFVSALPKTISGKIRRVELRQNERDR